MTINRRAGYAMRRPFWPVDPNASIQAGMVAFLRNIGGVATATVAASGTVPIGTFWKDAETGFFRTTVEQHSFAAAGTFSVNGGNFRGTAFVKITNSTNAITYTQGTDYTINTTSGVVTRVAGGTIVALQTVNVWYTYSITARDIQRFGTGSNYDRAPDDTQGSGKIAVVEGWAHIYTDQFDPTQTYNLNASLYPDANSRWTTNNLGTYSMIGRVIQTPSVASPFLGVNQIPVAA